LESIYNAVLLTADQGATMERLFNLDLQLVTDAVLTMIAVFVLFLVMSYLLFNPVRDLLKKRQEKIKTDIDTAEADKKDAKALKDEYDKKMKVVEKEAEEILAEARKKALQNENRIIQEAKEEANEIIKKAKRDAELEKSKALDEMKKEMIDIASLMAGKVVKQSINTEIQDSLIEETLKEVGEGTWQS